MPASYGTGKLHLTARDPHWLYAHWDLAGEEQRRFNRLSAQQHLIVRVSHPSASQPASEAHVHPESRHWFIYVENAGAPYLAELGYYTPDHRWVAVAASAPFATPAEAPSQDKAVEFITLPSDIPLSQIGLQPQAKPPAAPVSAASHPERRLGECSVDVRRGPNQASESVLPVWLSATAIPPPQTDLPESSGSPETNQPALPAKPFPLPLTEWTPARERALVELTKDEPHPDFINSITIAQLLRRQDEQELAGWETVPFIPPDVPELLAGLAAETKDISSPAGGEQPKPQRFRLSINAELVVYGGTEPNALVTIGGRPIQLRPDGSFSYRFALPDGAYELPICATSAQGETRQVTLQFHRATSHEGEVGAHPQDPTLKPPAPENAV